MKKVDLHIHTVRTESDARFTYSLATLKHYVEAVGLDCIAITNHNVFDLYQFNEINESLDITVLPGIEIDLENGHMLLISDNQELELFSEKCQRITELISYPNPNITLDNFKAIFPDLGRYILIPHYDKTPKVKQFVIDDLSNFITAGEVQSAKKFINTYKQSDDLVPVLFSDMRMGENITNYPFRYTCLNISDCDFRSIKLGISKREHVSLTEEEGNDFIEVMNGDVKISTGLNVILGKRSSGKSYTLNSIYQGAGEDDVKYIKQFELLESDEGRDKKDFDDHISRNQSDVTERYLSLLKIAIDDIQTIDLRNDDYQLERFAKSLSDNANNQTRKDAYSKVALFSETLFPERDSSSLASLISSVQNLLNNLEYSPIVEKHLSRTSLIALHADLVAKYKQEESDRRIKRFTNDLILSIKSSLNVKTTLTPIEQIDLKQIALNRVKVQRFNELAELVKLDKRIDKKELYGYSVVAERSRFKNATELQRVIKRKLSLVEAFGYYDDPVAYIEKLRESGVEDSEVYKLITKVNYRILNKFGDSVSGGERSEYRLLRKLNDAKNYDILLIDEPESSFDNTFLFGSVNSIIKDLSKQMPVVVVTHNSTVGSSIIPNYIIYTEKSQTEDGLVYDIYSGRPTDKYLYTKCGKSIENYIVQMDSLEAGESPYAKRSADYETIKN
ncbi:histidinol phosphatase [Pseudoalteromonas sp. CH_XMU1449-3]|uniref:histidinol phosphatase n=1 Tax=Pseudoalteromonas sp. CH_XMU1449-3 TaxID=3107774 RepID=UPI00300B1F81